MTRSFTWIFHELKHLYNPWAWDYPFMGASHMQWCWIRWTSFTSSTSLPFVTTFSTSQHHSLKMLLRHNWTCCIANFCCQTINRIKNKRFCSHTISVYCVYLLCLYKYTAGMYLRKNCMFLLNIFIYNINYIHINIYLLKQVNIFNI